MSIYGDLGVNFSKEDVKGVFGEIIKKDFPDAFCNIVIDADDQNLCHTKHSDGSGSKSVQRCLHYAETGCASIFEYDPYDALPMNIGDIASSGFVKPPFYLTDTIGINSHNLDKPLIISRIAIGIARLQELYKSFGMPFCFMGGETADLPDQIKSYVLDMDVFASQKKENIIKGNIEDGDEIFGFSSGGQAVWEEEINSGQMSNGLTMSRICLMHESYSDKYPHLTRPNEPYRGRYFVNDYLDELKMSVSNAILSPTRQWAFVIKHLLDILNEVGSVDLLHGIVMNTGGGATKILNIGDGIVYEKTMPEALPLFKLIQSESKENWRNMYKTFNMGIGLDVIGSPKKGILKLAIEKVANLSGIESYNLGRCHYKGAKNTVQLKSPYGDFSYF